MVYMTGDCHGDWRRFDSRWFPDGKDLTSEDFVIVCGDFGLWRDTADERQGLNSLEELPFNILFVDGNHENFDRLYSDEFEELDFHGGRAHKIRKNVFHLMRGYVFELCGKKFFAFGGASSHDCDDGILDRKNFCSKQEFEMAKLEYMRAGAAFRVAHESWWEQELPSDEEMQFGMETLDANDNSVDFIVTHCAPQQIASVISRGMYKPDSLTSYFNVIAETVDFKRWFFGHYHEDARVLGKFDMLYHNIVRIV